MNEPLFKTLLFSGNDNNEEWEAELEGELNDYEMVNSKGTEEDPEWENQIQQMLDAEDKQNQNFMYMNFFECDICNVKYDYQF